MFQSTSSDKKANQSFFQRNNKNLPQPGNQVHTKPAFLDNMPAQMQEKEEELQAKTDTTQLAEDEEEIQAKPDPAQMMEEEEDVQMKEEEELQAKSDTAQMQNSEEEELMQGKAVGQLQTEEEEQVQGKIVQNKAPVQLHKNGTKSGMPEAVQTKMEGSFGTDFSNVNIHENDNSATQMGALAYTRGNNVHFAPGQYNPGSQKGQELLGHELTHVVQQRAGRVTPTRQGKGMPVNDSPSLEKEADVLGAKAAQGKSAVVNGKGNGIQKANDLSSVPADNKKKTKIATTSISQSNTLADLFDLTKNYVIDEPVKSNTSFNGVNSDMEKGLKIYIQSILGAIQDGQSITRKLNFKTDKPADISGYSADSQAKLGKDIAYRFTAYDEAKSGTKKIIIEELGEITDKAPTADETKKIKDTFDKYFTFGVNKKKVLQDDGTEKEVSFTFSASEKNDVYKSVSLLPDDVLQNIKDVKFLRDDINPHTANEAGHYNTGDHTITLYDLCFKSGKTLYGNLANGFHTGAEQTVVHELAHAVDNAKHKTAWEKYQTAQNDSNQAIDDFNNEVATYNALVEKYNKKEIDKATLDKAKKELDKKEAAMNTKKAEKSTAEKAYLDITSPSGVKKKLENNTFKDDGIFHSTDFSKAVKTDGDTPITDYGGTDTGESFAESFALYYVDNERFSTLRPEQKKYFDAKKYQ